MASSSVIATLRSSLKTVLEARVNLSGVAVYRYPIAADDRPGDEYLMMGDVNAEQDYHAMGAQMMEDARLEIIVHVRKPGGGETVAASAESRALALWAEVEKALKTDHTVSGAVLRARVESYELTNGIEPGNRVAVVDGRIVFDAQLAAS